MRFTKIEGIIGRFYFLSHELQIMGWRISLLKLNLETLINLVQGTFVEYTIVSQIENVKIN